MARGDITFFQEAVAKMIEGNWADSDQFWCAVCDNTVAPTAGTATPVLGDFTQVGTAGTYATGGLNIGALSALVTQSGAVMKFDSLEADPTWAKDAGNDVDAYWGIVYNYTDAGKDCVCFVDLGGPVDMTAGALTITWNASGIFTITIT